MIKAVRLYRDIDGKLRCQHLHDSGRIKDFPCENEKTIIPNYYQGLIYDDRLTPHALPWIIQVCKEPIDFSQLKDETYFQVTTLEEFNELCYVFAREQIRWGSNDVMFDELYSTSLYYTLINLSSAIYIVYHDDENGKYCTATTWIKRSVPESKIKYWRSIKQKILEKVTTYKQEDDFDEY
jgi:hypothetical protein